MAGDKKEDPFAGFTDHSADVSDTDGNLVVADDSPEGGNDTTVDNDDDAGNDDDQDNSQKEMNLGEEEDDDVDPDELEDDSEGDADEEEGGEDDGDDQNQDDPDNIDDGEDEPEPAPKKKKQTAEQRIAEFRKKQGKADRRADTAETLLDAANTRIDALEARLTPGDEGGNEENNDNYGLVKPDPTDLKKYPYGELDVTYQSDIAEYRVELKFAERDAKATNTQQEAAAQEAAEGLKETYDNRVVDGITVYEDFETVVVDAADKGDFPLTETVGMLALESEVGHHVLYKIASDLEYAKKLEKMTPAEQGREFGRLEAQFDKRTPPKKKNKTKTAPPASRRRGGKAGSGRIKGNTNDFAAFEAQANADQTARAKR